MLSPDSPEYRSMVALERIAKALEKLVDKFPEITLTKVEPKVKTVPLETKQNPIQVINNVVKELGL